MFVKNAALFCLGAWGALAQYVPAPTDLITKKGYAGYNVRYKEVPTGICELDANVKSYSGYVDVAPDKHVFFWFFETRKGDPKKAPLTTWINGGPGSSSMVCLIAYPPSHLTLINLRLGFSRRMDLVVLMHKAKFTTTLVSIQPHAMTRNSSPINTQMHGTASATCSSLTNQLRSASPILSLWTLRTIHQLEILRF